jgi:GTP-sensing pleiotropic transcriptional regulator CodY
MRVSATSYVVRTSSISNLDAIEASIRHRRGRATAAEIAADTGISEEAITAVLRKNSDRFVLRAGFWERK